VSPTARRRLSWTALAAGVALAVALTVWWLLGEQDRSRTRSAARAEATEMAPRPGAARVAPPRPRLEIPSIGVSAHAVDLGLERNGTLEVPKRYEQVGLWKNGPEPGRRGPAVIAGHVDSRTAPAVFQRLRELGRGDRVRWESENGGTEKFVVTRSEEHPKAQFPTARVYGKTRRRELRLITCSGPADSSGRRSVNNLIVYARRV